MVGLTSYGVHIPRFRLDSATIEGVWGSSGGKGERSVANYDEDSLSMAAQAVLDCQRDQSESTGKTSALYYCSTTSPYKEKLVSTIIADVADLGYEIDTCDFSNSLRSGTSALKVALDSAKTRNSSSIIVASDCRVAEPGSAWEAILGDGACALSIGGDDLIAVIEGFYSVSKNFADFWRLEKDAYVKTSDTRFIQIHGLMEIGKHAVKNALTKFQLNPENFAKIVISSPDKHSQIRFAKELGFDVRRQMSSLVFDSVGNTGTAHGFLMLVSVLEDSQPGDRILFVNYGDGADVLVFKVVEGIRKIQAKRKFETVLKYKRRFPHYVKYLLFKDAIKTHPEPEMFSSIILEQREHKQNLGLYGRRCLTCSTTYYPMMRVCPHCGSQDEYEEVKMSRSGKVHTFNRDRVFLCPDPPLIMAVVDLYGDERFYGQMTDCDEDEIEIGLPVELVFRKFHDAKGFVNYFWKARPAMGNSSNIT